MFHNLIQYPIESPLLSWTAKQVVKDIKGKPNLFIRIKLEGTHFPHRAAEPFVRIGRQYAKLVEISEDGLSVRAYFDTHIYNAYEIPIEFGYDDDAYLRFSVGRNIEEIKFLDYKRLKVKPANLGNFTETIY